jgi:alpha-glucosidase
MHRDEEGINSTLKPGFYHIIVLRTANPMEVEYVKGESLRFKVVGGIVELKFIFGGANPREAIEKYHRYVNGWALHPFWSSGWHQSRWGYKSSQELLEVVANYTKYNLPLDVMWSDLDYMDSRKDFTLDVANFKPEEMKKMMDKENPEGVEWVPIIDPGIAVDSDCARRGLEANIFI